MSLASSERPKKHQKKENNRMFLFVYKPRTQRNNEQNLEKQR